MLLEQFKRSLGKSKGSLSLFDHSLGCATIALQIAMFPDSVAYPKEKLDQLLFSIFVHDIGKLDEGFQAMLRASAQRQPLPKKRIKHEASTMLFENKLPDGLAEIIACLEADLDYKVSSEIDLDCALAFAVSHHGLFYLSFEIGKDGKAWKPVRREWACFYPMEFDRITLVDLLFEFHPLGGLVIVSDLIHSYSYENGIPIQEIVQGVNSFRELIERLLPFSADIEQALQRDDTREPGYGLRDMLMLLLGGLR